MSPDGAVRSCSLRHGLSEGLNQAWRVLQVVISSAFETSLGLATLVHFAAVIGKLCGSSPPIAHGLGTAAWFVQDIVSVPLLPHGDGSVESGPPGLSISVAAAQHAMDAIAALSRPDVIARASSIVADLDKQFQDEFVRRHATEFVPAVTPASSVPAVSHTYKDAVCASTPMTSGTGNGSRGLGPELFPLPPSVQYVTVQTPAGRYTFRTVHYLQPSSEGSRAHDEQCTLPVLFLHGFLGSAEDWGCIATALAGTRQCVAVDLPGHGKTMVWPSQAAGASVARLPPHIQCYTTSLGFRHQGYSAFQHLSLKR